MACAVATDATLAGRPAVARSTGATSITLLEDIYGGAFKHVSGQAAIEAELLAAGHGARGIVFGARGLGELGHVFNGVNQGGTIRFLDGQSGGLATFQGQGYRNLYFLRTN